MIHRACCDPMHSVTSHSLNSVDEATDTVRSSFALICTTVKNQLEADVILANSCVRVAGSQQELFGTHVKVYGHRPGLEGD